MGNGKVLSRRGWAWVTGLAFVAVLLAGTPGTSQAVEVGSGDDIMIFVAHPDDDIITAAGVTMDHFDNGTGDVTVVFMTNGERCESPSQASDPGRCPGGLDSNIGTTRQQEAVNAQKELGVATGLGGSGDNNLIFLGYPNGFVDKVRYGDQGTFPVLVHTATWAGYGLGDTDWHDYRTASSGQHVAYPSGTMSQDLMDDVVALLNTYRPDHIFTHSLWDRHEDHHATYLALIDAIKEIQDVDPSYDPYIHSAIVHVENPAYWNNWPASADPTAHVENYGPSGVEDDSDDELVWDQRESIEVPASMQQSTGSGNNPKWEGIQAHSSQLIYDQFIERFAHKDEVFWVERLGEAEGIPDSYAVAEGGFVSDPASGVLANDVRGIAPNGGPPAIDPTPLGPMSAELVSGPVHASSFSLNPDGSFSYVHDGSETSSDYFTYRPVQGSTDGLSAMVTINVSPVNDAPSAVADSYSLENGATLNVPADGVLDNDTDSENDSLTAVKVSDPAHGSLSFNSDGSFIYTHDGSATTSDSFSYKANDGQDDSNTATVSLAIDEKVVEPGDPLDVSIGGPAIGATGVGQHFTATVLGGEGTKSYLWSATHNGTTVDTGTGTSFDFSSAVNGEYTISLTVTDSSGDGSDTHDLKLMGDIAGLAFTSDIIWLADAGITQGCNPPANDMYCPNDRVTRGQMAAFLVRFLGLVDVAPGIAFDDINGSVFETDILKLATAGITKGCNPPANDMYCPNDYVTRGQMAAFLVRALGLASQDPGIDFVDDNGTIFEDNIEKLATAGVTKGCNPPTNDMFCPDDYVTRGQMAAFLHRADGL